MTRIDWETAKVTATTKMKVLEVLKFLPQEERRNDVGELVDPIFLCLKPLAFAMT